MEEYSVESVEAEQQVASDDGAQVEVSAADLLPAEEKQVDSKADAPAPEKRADDAKPERKIETQKDFEAALSAKRKADRADLMRQYESSDEYQLGKSLLEERAAKDGISTKEAAAKLREERIKAKAARYKDDPQSYYEDMLREKEQPARPEPPKPASEAQTLAESLVRAKADGVLPEEFDPSKGHITPEFIADVKEFGVAAAAKIWRANQKTAITEESAIDRIDQRRRSAQPIRTTGESIADPKVDYENMSPEQFRELEKQMRRKADGGAKVRL